MPPPASDNPERDPAPMARTFDEASRIGKEFMDNGFTSLVSLSTGLQAIAVETGEYSRKSLEEGSAAAQKLLSAGSLDKAVEIQTDYARTACAGYMAQTARLGVLYAELALETLKPFESPASKAR